MMLSGCDELCVMLWRRCMMFCDGYELLSWCLMICVVCV